MSKKNKPRRKPPKITALTFSESYEPLELSEELFNELEVALGCALETLAREAFKKTVNDYLLNLSYEANGDKNLQFLSQSAKDGKNTFMKFEGAISDSLNLYLKLMSKKEFSSLLDNLDAEISANAQGQGLREAMDGVEMIHFGIKKLKDRMVKVEGNKGKIGKAVPDPYMIFIRHLDLILRDIGIKTPKTKSTEGYKPQQKMIACIKTLNGVLPLPAKKASGDEAFQQDICRALKT